MSKEKVVYVAWTNSDLTEGRGRQKPLFVCESPTTAARLGKGKSVQGCDCEVTKESAIERKCIWHAPVEIIPPTDEDRKIDERNAKKEAVLRRAKAAGLSDEELDLLRG